MSSTALVPIEAVGREIKARVEAGDKALDKAEQHYIAAGIQLLEAKARLAETREMRWSAFLFSHARMDESTARKYMSLANGDTTLEEIRERDREKQRASRAKRKEAAEQKRISGDVTRQFSQQNQCAGIDDARITRIVGALSAATPDTLTQIERLLGLEETKI